MRMCGHGLGSSDGVLPAGKRQPGPDTDLSRRSRDRTHRHQNPRSGFLYVLKAARDRPQAPPPGRAPAAVALRPSRRMPGGWRGQREARRLGSALAGQGGDGHQPLEDRGEGGTHPEGSSDRPSRPAAGDMVQTPPAAGSAPGSRVRSGTDVTGRGWVNCATVPVSAGGAVHERVAVAS